MEITYIYFDKLPNSIHEIILDYFIQEIKDICANKPIYDAKKILNYEPQWMINLIHLFDCKELFELNARYGNLENMKWLLNNNYYFDTEVFKNAALNGNLDNIQWLHLNNFPFDDMTINYAIQNGNLENIKWLLENRFPFTMEAFYFAFNEHHKTGDLEIIKLLLNNSVPYDEWIKIRLKKRFKLI